MLSNRGNLIRNSIDDVMVIVLSSTSDDRSGVGTLSNESMPEIFKFMSRVELLSMLVRVAGRRPETRSVRSRRLGNGRRDTDSKKALWGLPPTLMQPDST